MNNARPGRSVARFAVPAAFPAFVALLLLALALSLLSGCGGAPEKPPLADAAIGGPFTLTDQDGKRVSDTDFAGKYRLIYFGYTWCPDVCPVDVQNLMRAYKDLEASNPALAAKIQPIFITVDPQRDTPAKLKQFVSAFHPKLIGLTGSEAEVAKAADAFRVYSKKQPPGPDGNYLVDHMRAAFLMDPNGKPLALISQDAKPPVILAELERWAR